MAFASGKVSTDAVVFPKYIGIGTFQVVALNPTKAEAEKLYGRELEKEPEYTSVDEKTGIKQVRLDFIIKTVPEKNNGIELLSKISYFLKQQPRITLNGLKVQVINEYGEATWVTTEQLAAGLNEIPEGVASWFEGPYREAVTGEEELTSFLKIYLNIPGKSFKKKDGTVVYLENPEDAKARLENINNYFSGNVKEISDIIKMQPDNKIQLPIGVKTTDDNKQYQDCFTKMPLRSNTTNYSKLDAEIQSAKAAGSYSHTEFSMEPLHEYVVAPTSFAAASPSTPVAPVAAPAAFATFFGATPPEMPTPVVPPVVTPVVNATDDVPF